MYHSSRHPAWAMATLVATIVCLPTALLAATPALPQETLGAPDIQRLGAARLDLQSYTRACISSGLPRPDHYELMPQREAFAKVDELIGLHAARVTHWENCLRGAAPRITAFRQATDEATQWLMSVPGLDAATARKVTDLLRRSTENMTGMIEKAFPMLEEMNRGYLAFFTQLKAQGPAATAAPLVLPPELGQAEREVFRSLRDQVVAAGGYLEALYLLLPTPELRARMNVAKILNILYRSLDQVMQPDARPFPQKLRDFRQEFQVAAFIAFQESENAALQVQRPDVAGRYKTMVQQMAGVQDLLGAVEGTVAAGPARPAEEEAAQFLARIRGLLAELGAAVDRVEATALSVDAELSRPRP